MRDDLDILRKTENLRDMMEKHLGVKARTFEKACASAGRRIPRHLRKSANRLSEAAQMAQNPKLQRYMDTQSLTADYTALQDWLRKKNYIEERKTKRLNLAALIAFQLLSIVTLALIVLRWRGVI